MELKRQKVIHKRVLLREKMARLARLRHRKDKNVFFAQVKDLDLPPKYKPQNGLYENYIGTMIRVTDEGIDAELSLLNCHYFSNSITVQQESNKVVRVKLHKNEEYQATKLTDEILNEWERRDDPFWAKWVENYKKSAELYNNFLDTHKEQFEAIQPDEESVKLKKAYVARRDKLMSERACGEMTLRLNDKGSAVSELAYNSSFIRFLNYEFEEFIQKILVEGVPKLSAEEKKDLKKIPESELPMEQFINQNIEFNLPESFVLAKNGNHKRVQYSILLAGYFVKNAAELSIVISINDSEMLLEGEPINRPVYRLYLEQKLMHENEKRYFLEMYYKDYIEQLMAKPKQICQIRAVNYKIEEISEDADLTGIDSDEDLVVKDNGESQNNCNKEESIFETPYTSQLTVFAPQLQLLKTIYQKQISMLEQFAQDSVNTFLIKKK